MRNDDDCAAAAHYRHLLPARTFANHIQGAGSFNKNENPGNTYQSAGDCNPLTLTAGHACPVLTNEGPISLRHLANKFMRSCKLGRFNSQLLWQTGVCYSNVVID